MDFQAYSKSFRLEALNAGFDNAYVDYWLSYAERLNSRSLPIIYDGIHFSRLVGYRASFIYAASNRTPLFYREFGIKKKSGDTRLISEPLPSLKEVQKWIDTEILRKLPVSKFAKGFVSGESTKSGARFHRRQKIVLNLDIRDFFPKTRFHHIEPIFKAAGYSKSVVGLLTRLCLLNGSLPQGASTSPTLSNLVMFTFDSNIGGFCAERKIRYTRYADDMTFSGDLKPGEIIRYVSTMLNESGYSLSRDKTRVMSQSKRQEVTGVVVNDFINAPRELRRDLRQAAYYIEKFGLDHYLAFLNETRAHAYEHLLGLANYALFLNPKDRDALKLRTILQATRSLPES